MFHNALEASSYDLDLQSEKHIFEKYEEKNMGFHTKCIVQHPQNSLAAWKLPAQKRNNTTKWKKESPAQKH
jgi:hypothetical protein